MPSFYELNLTPEILSALDDLGFSEATPVQTQTIPIIFSGADILAQSQTGTGKTIAFGIPAVQSIDPTINKAQVLVLSPTRELSQQCGDEIRKLAKYTPAVRTADILGGANYDKQFKALRSANFVIGTPGRVMDHMRRGSLKLGNIKMVILDEADEMLNMGFKEDIEHILKDVPEQRQVVLFSATISKGIKAIAEQFLNNPVSVDINKDNVVIESIKQSYVHLPKHQKADTMKLLFHRYKPRRSIVFSNTKSMVDEIVEILSEGGFSVEGLHGDMKQQQRTKVMNSFKRGEVNILVATDVAARGIDVSDIDYVINYDIPKMKEYYVHRIGRTGRAGRDGNAITLCCSNNQVSEVQRLAASVKTTITQMEIPTISDIIKNNKSARLDAIRELLTTEQGTENTDTILSLIDEGHDAVKIAAALMSLSFSTALGDLKDVAPPKSKKGDRGRERGVERADKGKHNKNADQHFINIAISCGRAGRIAPNHIVGAVTERVGISSKDIGKITIGEDYSIVGIPVDIVEDVLSKMQGCKICGKPVAVDYYFEERVEKGRRSHKGEDKKEKRHGGSKHHGHKHHSKHSNKKGHKK